MLLYFLTCDILHIVLPGVSIKIEEASSLGRVTDCINKGPLVPFSRGGGGGGQSAFPPTKFLIAIKCDFQCSGD